MDTQFVMRKEFVTSEIAKKLKELGFDAPTIAAFVPDLKVLGKLKFELFDTARKYDASIDPDVILLPLWQQVFDWLMEKHKLVIEHSYWNNTESHGFLVTKMDPSNRSLGPASSDVKFSKAREFAVLKALELVNK